MKRLYSVIASTSREIVLTEPDILLEAGPNVFTVTTANIDDIVERLRNRGAFVRTVHCISQPEPLAEGSGEVHRWQDGERLDL